MMNDAWWAKVVPIVLRGETAPKGRAHHTGLLTCTPYRTLVLCVCCLCVFQFAYSVQCPLVVPSHCFPLSCWWLFELIQSACVCVSSTLRHCLIVINSATAHMGAFHPNSSSPTARWRVTLMRSHLNVVARDIVDCQPSREGIFPSSSREGLPS